MRKKNYKGRCEKRVVGKYEGVCRIYDPMQSAYAAILQQDDGVVKFQCNVLLEGLAEGEYTSEEFGDRYLRISFSIPTEEIKVFCEEFPKAVEALRTK